jgi:hypothetical protein
MLTIKKIKMYFLKLTRKLTLISIKQELSINNNKMIKKNNNNRNKKYIQKNPYFKNRDNHK